MKVLLSRNNLPDNVLEMILRTYGSNIINKDSSQILMNIPENDAIKMADLYQGLIDVSENIDYKEAG